MSFLETRFPVNISVGARGGPKWRTIVTQTQSGWEQRLQKWSNIKSEYDVGYGVKSIADLQTIVEFFNEMRGRAFGFRFRDWLDYTTTDEPLTVTGGPTFQLIKTYGSGLNNYVRNITKPVASTDSIKRNSGSFTDYTLDTTTGIATFTGPLSTGSITGITQAVNAEITVVGHGLSVGDKVYFTGVSGMTEINTLVGEIQTTPTANTLTVDIDTQSFTAYTSGGDAEVYTESGDVWTWSGEFDVPVRFEQDSLNVVLDTSAIGSTSVVLEEIRL